MSIQRICLAWLLFASILISGCEGVAAAASIQLEPCSTAENVYTDPLRPNYINFYEDGIANINNSAEYYKYQEQTFKELVNQIYEWSDTVDINSDEKRIRITITYISPEIAHLIVINHYLYKRITTFNGRLEEQVKTQLAGIVNRNEHIFFVTIVAPSSADAITLEFPISELALTNTSNLTLYVEHEDHNLEGPITLRNDPEYGFIYYSMAVMKNGRCQAVFDKNRDTRIVLTIPKMTIADGKVGTQSWKYKYAPLINMKSVSPGPKKKFDALSTVQFTPENSALSSLGNLNDSEYWTWLARIIWLETTLDP